ncbi:MAG TPA: radical SAM protein [Candidatus Omnitrophota bacterium]|nr:radical SAM protein [Candidatus Omnitrophota bacterium]
MDICFIYPPVSVRERYGLRKLGKVGGHLPPLGLAYLAAVCRTKGYHVSIIDAPAIDASHQDILAFLREEQPAVVGLSAVTVVFHRAVILAEAIRRLFPDMLIVIGGHHASIMPRQVIGETPHFDIAVYGEGEATMVEILARYRDAGFCRDAFLADKSLCGITGIAFRRGTDIVVTQPRQPIPSLDELPYPAWDLLSMDRYIPLPNQYVRKPVVHMVATRGCPYSCGFCSNNAVFGKQQRYLSPRRLIEQMDYVEERFGAREISFWDDSMTTNRAWLEEFCRERIRTKRVLGWSCYSRVDTVDPAALGLMKQAGCWNIFYGFESGSQELLDGIDKRITIEQIRQVTAWTKKAGIQIRASFMIALPKETPELARKTIDFAVSLDPDYAQFSVTTLFPQTKLWDEASRYGTVQRDFSRYTLWDPVFIPWGYRDKAQIEEIERLAMRRFYLRPRYIWGRIRSIRSYEDIVRYLKGFLLLLGFLGFTRPVQKTALVSSGGRRCSGNGI